MSEPRFSDDRQWWWNGREWVPSNQAPTPPPPPPYEGNPPARRGANPGMTGFGAGLGTVGGIGVGCLAVGCLLPILVLMAFAVCSGVIGGLTSYPAPTP
jgi:hypothetical protein